MRMPQVFLSELPSTLTCNENLKCFLSFVFLAFRGEVLSTRMVRQAMGTGPQEEDLMEHFLFTLYQCMICGKKFDGKEKFYLHVKKHAEFKKKVQTEESEKSILRESSVPVETDTGEGTLQSFMPEERDTEEGTLQPSMPVETDTGESTLQPSADAEPDTGEGTLQPSVDAEADAEEVTLRENEESSVTVRREEPDDSKMCKNRESFTCTETKEATVRNLREDSSVPVEAETEEVEDSTLHVEFSVHEETEEPEEMTLPKDKESSIPVESKTSKQSARDNLQCHLSAKTFDEENDLIEHLTRHSETGNKRLLQNTTGKLNYCPSPLKCKNLTSACFVTKS